ncbi:MAG: outer membrane lipoprotein carrier protein LolA [Caulobacteraceae bacterium]
MRALLLAIALLAAWVAPAAALTPADDALVARAVAYFQGLSTARGRFVQTDPRGGVSGGTFWLQRPGRARFDYDPPSGLVIASDGFKVQVVDKRLKTVQSYLLGATPLSLFLARDIRLDRGVKVAAVTRSDGAFTVLARDAAHPDRGQIALTFTEKPLTLTGWTLTDSAGQTVKVRLLDFAAATPRPKAFFTIDNPKRLGG